MGENSKIEWTDHTFNPWIGCTRVSPACDHCYAEALNRRWGHDDWGAGKERRRTSPANWRKPIAWDRAAEKVGVRRRVFCASLADVFDAEVGFGWRDKLMDLIRQTPFLDWLLLTKRPQVAKKFFDAYDLGIPPNVWLGTTVENQPMADLRIPILLSIPAKVRFLSIEPMLGPIRFLWPGMLDWVIAGGESGPKARPSHPDWFRSLRDQCQSAGVPFFFKQWGEWAPVEGTPRMVRQGDCFLAPGGSAEILGPDLGTELEDCGTPLRRVGKARAGAKLDGREHREFPTEAKP